MSENKIIYNNEHKVLSVKNLQINFRSDHGIVHAVRGVSFDLYKGETLCIVGESGSGKSVTSKTIMGILPANAIISNGQIIYEGEDLVRVSEEDFHRIRGNKIGMIFQDPLSALNPIVRVGKQLVETTLINSNILKRRYHDYIANDLTAFRNLDANRNYELGRIKRNAIENKELIKENEKLTKKLQKPLKEEVKVETEKKLAENVENIKGIVTSFVRGLEYDKKSLEEKYQRNLKREQELAQKTETEDGVSLELRIKKRELRNKGIKAEIELINKYEAKDFASLDIISALKEVLNYFEEKKTVLNVSYKEQKPVLFNILKGRRKAAKKDVDEYHAKIKEEKRVKLEEINAKKEALTNEFNSYKASLEPNLLKECENVVKYNKKLEAKRLKNENKFKETSVSKVVKEESKVKEIPDAKYVEFYNGLLNLDKEIASIEEDYIKKTKITRAEAKKKSLEIMREVGIPMPERRYRQYPFEFSGGMRQRIVIAIALMGDPDVLILDEPTTALDVTIQAQILELVNRLKKERNLSCIFITHDLGVVAEMADRVAVMYAGKIVEYGLSNEIFYNPKHPYTWALLSSIPDIDSKERLEAIPGTPPDMRFPPKGDAFALRSKYALGIDFRYEPPFFKVSDTHYAATWLLYPDAPKVEMPKIVQKRIENALKGYNKEEVLKGNKAKEEVE